MIAQRLTVTDLERRSARAPLPASRLSAQALGSPREIGHELVLVYRGVTAKETRAVGFGKASFALVVEPPLIVLCYRFGDAIPWSAAPYHWHRVPDAERLILPEPVPADAAETALPGLAEAMAPPAAHVRVCLVEAEGGRVCVIRTAKLSAVMTRAWNAAIRRQTNRRCSEGRFTAALAQFYRHFPDPDALLARAVATSVDGG